MTHRTLEYSNLLLLCCSAASAIHHTRRSPSSPVRSGSRAAAARTRYRLRPDTDSLIPIADR